MRKFCCLLLFMAVICRLDAAHYLDILRKPRTIYSSGVSGGKKFTAAGFVFNDSLWLPASQETQVSISNDAKNLYIRFDMKEDPANMQHLHGREKIKITYWNSDLIEIMLQPPEGLKNNFWYHLAFDCAGHVFLARENNIPEMPGFVNMKEVDTAGIKSKVKLLADGWQVTAAVPLEKLEASAFRGDWRVNFGRTRIAGGKSQRYSWNRTKGYQESKNFGFLKFGVPAGAEKEEAAYLASLKKYQNAKAGIIAELKKRSYSWQYAFGKGEMYQPFDTIYSAEKGFGWLESGIKTGSYDKQNTRVWDSPINPLCDNYVYNDVPGSNGRVVNNFQVDLPNGKYKVSLLAGFIYEERQPGEKAPQRRRFSLAINGKKVRDYDIGTVMYTKDFFHAEVTDGKLVLTFDGDSVFPDRPETVEWAGEGSLGKYYRPGWIVNAICIYPAADRKAAEKQIATDQLELWFHTPEEIAKLEEVVIREPDIPMPEYARKQGFALFTRPLGELIYSGSRPKKGELTTSLSVAAAPGETFYLPFAMLPLKDMDKVDMSMDSKDIVLREAISISWLLGGGKYGVVPWYLDDYQYLDHDMNQGETKFFWLSGKIPMDAAAGKRNYTLRIAAEGKNIEVPVTVQVLPIKLEKTDFYYGGDFCSGYNFPRYIYDDRILELCKELSINTATLTLLKPEKPGAYENLERHLRFLKKMNYPMEFMIFYPVPFLYEEDHPLRQQKITRFSDKCFNYYMEAAQYAHDKMLQDKSMRFIYYFMDEAHCKSEPYWAEQIRIAKAVRERYPDMPIMASESEDSYWRSKAYVNFPRLHEVEDFNHPDLRGKFVTAYPSQHILQGIDINFARLVTGWICATTEIDCIYLWQLFEALQVNSGLRRSCWTMLVQSAVGGYRVMPRLATVMGQVGVYDQYYLNTLQMKLKEAENSSDENTKAKAAKISRKLSLILKEVKPSYTWYWRNGGVWQGNVFAVLRKFMIDSIIELDSLNK